LKHSKKIARGFVMKAGGEGRTSGKGRDWSASDIAYLLNRHDMDSVAEIAAALDRTELSVRIKLHRLRRKMPVRRQLPNRRLQVTDKFEWHGKQYLLSVGFDPEGRVGEVFLAGTKAGTDLNGLMTDACVLLSLLLQYGGRSAWIAGRLAGLVAAEDPHKDPELTSLIGMVARRAAALERDYGAEMTANYARAAAALAPAAAAIARG
jgi:hypothetical protein